MTVTLNQSVVTNFVARQMGEFHENAFSILRTANRKYEEIFNDSQSKGFAPGSTVNIKIPGYPGVSTGLTVTTPTAINDVVIPFVITEQDIYNVTYQWNLYQYKLNLVGGKDALTGDMERALVDNYAFPAHQAMATAQEQVAAYRLETSAFYCHINKPSEMSSLTSWSTIQQINKKMTRYEFQFQDRFMLMNLDDAASVASSLQNMFNQQINEKITKTAYVGGEKNGTLLAGLNLFQSNQINVHTSGALSNATQYPTITVGSVSSDGMEITLSVGGTSSAKLVNAGDLFAIPSVYLLKPIEFAPTNDTLVVTAQQDAFGDGAGNVTIKLPYPLMIMGMNANVESLPAPGAAVEAFPATFNNNYCYVPSGLSMVPVPMGEVYGADNSKTIGRGNPNIPVSVYAQGFILELSNIFRISQMLGICAFAPYVMRVPTLIV
jgi:hypothetical protein